MTSSKRAEVQFSALMFSNFFGIIAIFWILKTLKKGIFIGFYETKAFELFGHIFTPAQTEIFAKGVNVLNSVVVMLVITYCARFFKQRNFFNCINGVMVALLAVLRLTYDPGSELSVWALYLAGDLYVMTMVPSFMAFMNDSVDSRTAKKLYGPICLGGVLGGAFGSTSVRSFINVLNVEQWIIATIGMSLILSLFAYLSPMHENKKHVLKSETKAMDDQTTALRGAKKVFASPYLFGIMMIVFLYEIASATIDFQFTSLVSASLNGDELKAHFATVYTLVNWVAVGVQVFLTTLILKKADIRVALIALPALLAFGSTAFFIVPTLMLVSALPIIENGLNYSLNQSAREVLFTISPSRYSAKAFIDVFVNRFAKIVALAVSMTVSLVFAGVESLRWLSLFILGILVLWIFVANKLGRRFREATQR
jgi:AAA family ATP:ADP antiporter